MEFIEIQATFVVPADKADLFANRLSNVIHGFALYQLREQPYWYYGVWQNEWYGADPLSGDGVIAVGDVDKFSREKLETLWRELTDIPVNEEGEIEETFIHFPIGTDKIEVWLWFDKQEFEFPWAVKFSREKNASPSLDKESSHVRSNIARTTRLAMFKQRSSHVRSIVPVAVIHDDVVLKINVGVAKHVIDRKHYPDPRCKTQCTMMNTDYCRLACDEDRLEGLE